MTMSEFARNSQRAHWRTGVPRAYVYDDDAIEKVTCPVCGQRAPVGYGGAIAKHKVYDSRRRTVWAWCFGRER